MSDLLVFSACPERLLLLDRFRSIDYDVLFTLIGDTLSNCFLLKRRLFSVRHSRVQCSALAAALLVPLLDRRLFSVKVFYGPPGEHKKLEFGKTTGEQLFFSTQLFHCNGLLLGFPVRDSMLLLTVE